MSPVFKQTALVTAVSPYSFKSDEGRMMEGVTVEYLLTEDLAPVVDGDKKGTSFNKDSVGYEKRDNFMAVPGLYELQFTMQATRGGKPQLKVFDVSFVSAVKLELLEGSF
jgi:hypothetical protein